MKKLILFLSFCFLPVWVGVNAQVVISEVFYDSPLNEKMMPMKGVDLGGIHHNGEYVELYNPSAASVDLSGYKVGVLQYRYENFEIPEGTICKSRQCVVIAFRHPNSPEFSLKSLFQTITNQQEKQILYHASFLLGNTGNTVLLFDPQGRIVSHLNYADQQASGCNSCPRRSVHNPNAAHYDFLQCLEVGPADPFVIDGESSKGKTLEELLTFRNQEVADKSKTVGEIKSESSVSPSGAAVVEIPLCFPAGINGMEPNLSVAYNSQGALGPLGRGTSLSGLSAVSRGNKNGYFDSENEVIRFTGDGPYTLDGQRLLPDGQGRYKTYIQSLTKIEAVGESGSGPLYFRVTSPQGIVAEYGSEVSGRVYAGDRQNIISWLISKATDPHGNTITYRYTTDPAQGTYLKEIVYGENGQNVIGFNYTENHDTPATTYVDGSFFRSALLLSDIDVSAGATGFTKYHFNYDGDHLTEVVENGTGGEELSLDWEWNSYSEEKTPRVIVDAGEEDDGFFVNGDINGDGKTDLVRSYMRKGRCYLEVFVQENGQYVSKQTLELEEDYYSKEMTITYRLYNCMDINNDGKDELIVNMTWWKKDRGTANTLRAYAYDMGGLKQIGGLMRTDYEDFGDEHKIVVLNYNNNPFPDFAFIGKNGNVVLLTDCWNPDLKKRQMSLPFDYILQAVAFDYNGDGISELLINDMYTWYALDLRMPDEYTKIVCDRELPFARVTDLNGDGLEDLVFADKLGNLVTYTNEGNLKFSQARIQTDPDGKIKSYFNNPKEYELKDLMLVGSDFNNDGRSDLVVQLNIEGTNIRTDNYGFTRHHHYILSHIARLNRKADGNYEIRTHITDNWDRQIFPADFDNNGISEYGEFTYGRCVTYESMNVERRQLLSGIKSNGVVRSQFEYGFASDRILHICPDNGQSYSKDVKYLNLSMPLVRCLNQPNGTDKLVTTGYQYDSGKFHTDGLGFLGFGWITQTTKSGGNIRVRHTLMSLDKTFHVPHNYTVLSYLNGIKTEDLSTQFDLSGSNTGLTVRKTSEYVTNELEGSSRITRYGYDGDGRIERETTTFDDDSYNRTEYSGYNVFGQPGRIVKTKKHFHDDKEFSETTTNVYDDRSNLVKSIAFDGSSAPVTTTYMYYANGLLRNKRTTGSDTETVREIFNYRTENNRSVIQKQTAFALTTSYYNLITGNLEEESVALTGIPTPQVTRYSYDGLGRETGTVNPNGTKTGRELSWCTDGNKYYYKTVEKATGQNPVTKWFDVLGREVYTASRQGDVLVESASLYDEDGNKVSEITLHPQKTSWTDHYYSPDGRMERQITRTGRTVGYSYQGRGVTTDDNGRTSSRQLDSWGNVLTQTDPENTVITHRYSSNGHPVSTTVGSHTITMSYDDKGNQLKLFDPDIGEILYTYDAFGRVRSYRSPKGSYTLTYDSRGRVTQKAYASRVVDYTYYDSGNGVSQLKSAHADNGTSDEYTYNEYGQVVSHTQTTDNYTFDYFYDYDSWGRMIRQTSPNGYVQNYTYSDTDSHLISVTDVNHRLLWESVSEIPGIRQESRLGNNVFCVTSSSEDETERSIGYTCDNWPLLRFDYVLDPLLGNVSSRSETSDSKTFTERFGYDAMDRLIRVEGSSDLYIDYSPNGNIREKSDVGAYRYDSGRPHAVSDIEDPTEILKSRPGQQITYTEFNKVETIREGEYEMRFTYGPDEERVKSMLYCNGALYVTTYYGSGFDLTIKNSGKAIERTYLGDEGTFGMVRRDVSSGRETTYYFHCDLLGSLCAVTNYQGDIVERRSYDAWGRHRNPNYWSDYDWFPEMTLTPLGYIFQEEMPVFGLINLNGRLYDPLLGRMLSPDPYIQEPGMTQSYNRYAYCLNNPLKYKDPNGEFWHLIIGAAIGGILNWATHGAEFSWTGLGYFGVGAFSGALGAGIGSGISGVMSGIENMTFGKAIFDSSAALAVSAQGFISGLASGAGAGFAGGLVGGMGNSLVDGNSFGTSLVKGLVDGAIGGLSGGVAGGISAGIAAYADGRDFWHGGRITTDVKMDLKQIFQVDDSEDCRRATFKSFDEKYNGSSIDMQELRENFPNVHKNQKELVKMYHSRKLAINQYTPDLKNTKATTAKELADYLRQGKSVSYEMKLPYPNTGHATAITRVRIYDNGRIRINLMNPYKGHIKVIRNFKKLHQFLWIQKF